MNRRRCRWLVCGAVVLSGCGTQGSEEPAGGEQATPELGASSPTSFAAPTDIYNQVAELGERVMTVGESDGTVAVQLRPDQESAAQRLAEQYGDAIRIEVGALAFPLDMDANNCPARPSAQNAALDINGSAVVDAPVTPSEFDPGVSIELENTGSTPVRGEVSAPMAFVLRDSVVVATTIGDVGDVNEGLDLDSNTITRIPIDRPIASCDPALGYELPPGQYDLVVQTTVITDNGEEAVLTTPPTPMIVDET